MKLTTAFQLCNSKLITFFICLSLPDGTRHLMISCRRETIDHISAAAAPTAHLERTRYSLTCLQRRHPRCRESPSSGGMPAPGSRSPNARLGSSKQSLTWRRRALHGSWTQRRSLSGKHQAVSKTGCLKTYIKSSVWFLATFIWESVGRVFQRIGRVYQKTMSAVQIMLNDSLRVFLPWLTGDVSKQGIMLLVVGLDWTCGNSYHPLV